MQTANGGAYVCANLIKVLQINLELFISHLVVFGLDSKRKKKKWMIKVVELYSVHHRDLKQIRQICLELKNKYLYIDDC